MDSDLQSSWLELCERLKVGGVRESAGKLLLARYGEAHRAYHNREHLEECLSMFTRFRAAARQPDLVELAIWFHDAVYNPRARDNEELSADLAREFCREAGLSPDVGERAAALIMATKSHVPGEDVDAQLLVDTDLGILGQSRDRFTRYEDAIREEYSWVPEAEFRAGRTAVLRKFLSREWIYSTEFFRNSYEASARANLQWSLAYLAGSALSYKQPRQ